MKLNRVFDPSCPIVAMEPQAAERWYALLHSAFKGEISTADFRAAVGLKAALQRPTLDIQNGIACIAINGTIVRGEEEDDELWGLCSVESIRRQTLAAMNDDAVNCIAYMVDSPGGTVRGINELSAVMRQARAAKPCGAYTNGMMCSAAYWLGAQTDLIQCSDDALLGSIGVYSVMYDRSKQAEMDGIKVNVIKAGAMKGAGTPGTPITDEQIGEAQKLVDKFYGMFVSALQMGRKFSADDATKLADGRVYMGSDAVSAKLADNTGSIDDFMSALSARSIQATRANGLPKIGVQAMTEQEKSTAQNEALVAERKRITDINAEFAAADATFANKMIADGKSLSEAKCAYNEVLKAQLKAQADENATLKAAAAGAGNKVIPTASAKPSANQNESNDARTDFEAKVLELEAKGVSRQAAVCRVAAKYPDLHRQVVANANANNSEAIAVLPTHEAFKK